jgi:hypothetical protein
MRLTLRTLLAWLDDTLPPPEVRHIGQQVNESQFAQKLVERIGKVTRRRRLSVPSATGADASDPATVAAYLDNELPSDEVAEFEKKCLESDVQLAEVASVHQILSLIGQKAKVPTEARHRMYRLIKGRESVAPRASASHADSEPEPAAALLPPWQPPEIPSRSAWERFGPLAAVVGLLGLMIWSAWQIAGPTPTPEPVVLVDLKGTDRGGGNIAKNPEPKAVVDAGKTDAPLRDAAPPKNVNPEDNPAAKKDAASAEPTPPAEQPKGSSETPPGAVGLSGKIDGIALRYATDSTGSRWTRLDSNKGLRPDDRIANLAPYRTPIKVGPVAVELVGNVEIRLSGAAGDDPVRIDLLQGHVLIHGATPPEPLAVRFAGQTLRITPPANGVVGLERLAHRGAGDQHPLPAIRVLVPEGEAKLSVDQADETVTGPASVLWQPPAKLVVKAADAAPSWVTETAPSPIDQELGRQFAHYFQPDRSIDTSLNEALEDEQAGVRRFAIWGLGTVGALEMIVPNLSTPGKPDSRRAAINVLRAYEARGAEATKELVALLKKDGGDEWAENVQKLLEGFSPKEATEEATYQKLVKFLKVNDLSLRELAIENLESLTGRDSMEYDADQPEGKGVQAWEVLLKRKEIIPRAAAKSATKDK